MEAKTEANWQVCIWNTQRWICAIDHGGLFRVTDDVYVFFHEVER